MTSCVFPLVFFVFVTSSITVVDLTNGPTGVKVRITNNGLQTLKNVGMAFLGKLVNRTFTDFSASNKHISGLIFKDLAVTPGQVSITFQTDSGLKFEINDVSFSGELNVDKKKYVFEGNGLMIMMDVKLKRDQGNLTVEIPDCKTKVDKIQLKTGGIMRIVLVVFRPIIQYLFNRKMCPAIQRDGVPNINRQLGHLTMAMKPFEGLNISVDYSLSGDITGLVSRVDGDVNAGPTGLGTAPVFTKDKEMVYVGVSEFFFNSAAQTLYSIGAMTRTVNVTHPLANMALRALQLFMQWQHLMKPLYGTVEVTEAPSISISQKDGVTVRVNVTGQVTPETPTHDDKLISISVSATCKARGQVIVADGCLMFSSVEVSCTTDSGTVMNILIHILTEKVKNFVSALQVPLPLGLYGTLSDVYYNDGFLVVGGSLYFRQNMKELLLDTLSQQMNSTFQT